MSENQHRLVEDRYRYLHGEEHMTVRCNHASEIHRAVNAIGGIARLLHNSFGETDNDGSPTLGTWMHQDLADALECLAEFIHDRCEEMDVTADLFRRHRNESGGQND